MSQDSRQENPPHLHDDLHEHDHRGFHHNYEKLEPTEITLARIAVASQRLPMWQPITVNPENGTGDSRVAKIISRPTYIGSNNTPAVGQDGSNPKDETTESKIATIVVEVEYEDGSTEFVEVSRIPNKVKARKLEEDLDQD